MHKVQKKTYGIEKGKKEGWVAIQLQKMAPNLLAYEKAPFPLLLRQSIHAYFSRDLDDLCT